MREIYKDTGISKKNDYFGARYYDPKFSNWISTDPALGRYLSLDYNKIKALPKKTSLYQYAKWNPVMLIDPNGEDENYLMWMPVEEAAAQNMEVPVFKDGKFTGETFNFAEGSTDGQNDTVVSTADLESGGGLIFQDNPNTEMRTEVFEQIDDREQPDRIMQRTSTDDKRGSGIFDMDTKGEIFNVVGGRPESPERKSMLVPSAQSNRRDKQSLKLEESSAKVLVLGVDKDLKTKNNVKSNTAKNNHKYGDIKSLKGFSKDDLVIRE